MCLPEDRRGLKPGDVAKGPAITPWLVQPGADRGKAAAWAAILFVPSGKRRKRLRH